MTATMNGTRRQPDTLPHDTDAEQGILGGLLIDHARIAELDLKPRDFFSDAHQIIFDAMLDMHRDGQPIDVTLLSSRLKAATVQGDMSAFEAIGGTAYLFKIANSAPNSAHIVHHAAIVREASVKRDAWQFAQDIERRSLNGMPADDLMQYIRDRAGQVGVNGMQAENKPPKFASSLLSTSDFLGLDLRQEFLIEDILAACQPLVTGGRSKTLKTTIIADMVVSLGSGTPFLGMFASKQLPVAFWSGESGQWTLRETARRVARSKEVDLAECSIHWGFDLPRLGRVDHLDAMRTVISDLGLKVVVVDPLYLSLLDPTTAGQAGNVYAMGAVLQPLAEMAQETGVTLVVLHHFKKSAVSDQDEPASLESLSQSGIVEWARQWLLLERRSPYQADGRHELWMRTGGSFGHAGLWSVDVDEGVYDASNRDSRYWDVAVDTAGDARAAMKRQREQRKVEERTKRDADDVRKMLEALRRYPAGETKNVLRELAGLSGVRASDALRTLVGEGRAETVEIQKHTRLETGYKPCE